MAVTETGADAEAAKSTSEEPSGSAPGAESRSSVSVGSGAAANDHKTVGAGFLGLALVFLVVGGVLALLMRAQLVSPESEFANPRQYRQLFTYHGSVLVFLFLLPAWIGLATAMVPLQIGAGRLAFPRMQSLALWLTLAGGGLVVASPFVRGGERVVSGWTLAYPLPIGRPFRGDGVEYLLLGLAIVLGAAVLAACNLVVTVVKLRAPGLSARRIPLFSWSVLVAASVLLLALPVLIAGFLMLFVDHHYGGRLFNGLTSARGGNPLAWPRLFWFGAYPTLWALLLPALGVASEIVPVFARRRLADRRRAMAALAAVGILAFAGWGSEVRNLKGARPLFVLGALVVLAPVASLVLNWLLTLAPAAAGAKERRSLSPRDLPANPMLLILGFVSLLAVGLGAGAVSALGATTRLHSNYWSVGQQHLLYFAPATVAIVAAVHYWAPKLWGRHLLNGLGKLELLLIVGGAHLAFLAALILGLQDMTIHTSVYPLAEELQLANIAVTVGSVALAAGAVLFALDLLGSVLLGRGRRAEPDPWEGHTLEWLSPSPPPHHNFDELPEIRSDTPALDLREVREGREVPEAAAT